MTERCPSFFDRALLKLPPVFHRGDPVMLFEQPRKIILILKSCLFRHLRNGKRRPICDQQSCSRLQTAVDQKLLRRQRKKLFEQTAEMCQCHSAIRGGGIKIEIQFRMGPDPICQSRNFFPAVRRQRGWLFFRLRHLQKQILVKKDRAWRHDGGFPEQ